MIKKLLNIGQIGTVSVDIPVLEIGSGSPVGTILAVQHGGEWSPLWVIKSLLQQETRLTGTVRIVPVANPFGFIAGERNEVIEGKDLNRQYPGNVQGDFSARLANAIFTLCQQSDFVIDLHTFSRQTPLLAGYTRTPTPLEKTQKLIQLFSPDIVWVIDEKKGEDQRFQGSLDGALARVGIPCIFIEMPNFKTITTELIERISQGLINICAGLNSPLVTNKPIPEFKTKYLYTDTAGLFEPVVSPLQVVKTGDILGNIFTLPEFKKQTIVSPIDGTIVTIRGRDVVRTGSKLASLGLPIT